MDLNLNIRTEQAYYRMTDITDKLYAQSRNGNNFYKLYRLVVDEDNILLAYKNVKAHMGLHTAGVDRKTQRDYSSMSGEEIIRMVRG